MARRLLALSLPVVALLAMGAKKADPKHENHFRFVEPPKSDVVTIELKDAQAQEQFVAVDVSMKNKTADKLVVFRKGESKFVLPQGTLDARSGGLQGLLSGPVYVGPNDAKSFGFKAEGESGFHVEAFTFEPEGFGVASDKGVALAGPEFQLPPSTNAFDLGPFSCNLTQHKQTTDFTQATFECTYSGTGVGFVDARRIGARSRSGTEYANVAKNTKRDILLPGDKAKFPVWIQIPASDGDMQFVAFSVLFRDAFAEAEVAPLDLGSWRFELDAERTAAANK